jgi:hypothetical protein
MERLISHYLAAPGASSAARLVRFATSHDSALYHATSFDLSVLAEAEEVYVASRRERRLADRRASRATQH